MKKRTKLQHVELYIIGGIVLVFFIFYTVLPFFTRDVYTTSPDIKASTASATSAAVLAVPAVTHIKTPEAVKAIYMSACVVGTPSFREKLVDIADTTEVNSIVIDIKDFSGKLSFTPSDPSLKPYVSESCGAPDMEAFVRRLHEKNIYVIARLTTFQDPFFPKLHPNEAIRRRSDGGIWVDKNGLSFLNPASQVARDHVIKIAKAAHDIGFDEINFDYIRYPSDGNIKDISLPEGVSKPVVLESFFKYLHDHMREYGIVTSADLFGMTTTNYDDLGIGQVLERALPYFDYIAPMVYPSHYPKGFNGWSNPNTVPYDLIYFVMKRGVERTIAASSPIQTLSSTPIASTSPQLYTKEVYDKNKLRPWIQDFNYGGHYGPAEIRAQIQASYDVGLTSWLIWSPSNKYTLGALQSE